MSDKNIFTEMEGTLKENKNFRPEGSDYFNPNEFKKLVKARRSVRKFDGAPLADEVVLDCLDSGLLAPNSSNLQTWEFIRVKDKSMIEKLSVACFSQSAARTASELIVCIARTDKALEHCQLMLEEFKKMPMETPKAALEYYGKLAPFVYNTGPFSIYAPFKWLFFSVAGLFKVVPREPLGKAGIKLWATKSCALACENIMLAFRSYGLDTCPMEGFDSCRVKSLLNLNSDQYIVMILGVGKAVEGGIYGPQLRFDREKFIKTI